MNISKPFYVPQFANQIISKNVDGIRRNLHTAKHILS